MWLAKDNNLGYGWTGGTVRRNFMAVQMPNLGIFGLWIITGILTGISEWQSLWIMDPLLQSLLHSPWASLLEICYGWTCKPGGLPPGGCICDIQSLADNQRTNRGLLASHSRRKISLHDSRNSFDGLSEPSGTPVWRIKRMQWVLNPLC